MAWMEMEPWGFGFQLAVQISPKSMVNFLFHSLTFFSIMSSVILFPTQALSSTKLLLKNP
uniref:Uncharacterized protein n=1 Tax=Kalanchoe fedtschenkoi TaxID=63787 RepID=A0A7N0ZZM0_KALFE